MQSNIGEYQIIESICQDQYSKTYLCKNHKGKPFSVQQFAIKQDEYRLIKKQIIPLMQLQHPSIIQPQQFFCTQNQKYFNIISNFYSGSTLPEIISSLNFQRSKQLICQIAKAVKYLHTECKISHKNLKLENIIIHQDRIKIGNFSYRFLLNKMKISAKQSKYFYVPKQDYEQKQFNYTTDIWALGLIFLQIIIGKRIVSEDMNILRFQEFNEIINSQRDTIQNMAFRELLAKMLRENPRNRIDIQEIIQNLEKQPNTYQQDKKLNQNKIQNSSIDKSKLQKRPPVKQNDGTIYQGTWDNDSKEGQGVQIWPNGARYQGQWYKNQRNGQGKFRHADGDVYDGQWHDDKASGSGTYYHNNGAQYNGQWSNDQQHGYGVQTWADGSKYQGEYKFGQKCGKGIYRWADGSSYQGEWKQNRLNGFGQYQWSDGRLYKGDWCDNMMNGQGTYYWSDGRKYVGEYKKDKKDGFGIHYWPDGKRYQGQWANGKMQGKGKIVLKDGTQKHGTWKEGTKVKK